MCKKDLVADSQYILSLCWHPPGETKKGDLSKLFHIYIKHRYPGKHTYLLAEALLAMNYF